MRCTWCTHFGGAPPGKSESSASQIFRHSGITVAFKTTLEVFTRVGPDNAGCPCLRELYLTAISAGGSRSEQASRAVQGQGCVLRGLHPRGAPDRRVADAVQCT
jgi:hypothetical protein